MPNKYAIVFDNLSEYSEFWLKPTSKKSADISDKLNSWYI